MRKRIISLMLGSTFLFMMSTHGFATDISFENVTMTIPDEWVEDSESVEDKDSVRIQYMGDQEAINITTAPYAEEMADYSELLLDAFLYGIKKTEGYTEIDSSTVEIDGNQGHMTTFFTGKQMENTGILVSFDTGASIANLLYLCMTSSDNDISIMTDIVKSIKIGETEISETGSISTKSEQNYTKYLAGVYKVGVDIPSGEYIVFATRESGYFCVSSDSNQDNILFNDNFDYNSIITVNDGEYLDLSRCYAIPIEEIPEVELTGEGMFKVGMHIPAGEYKVNSGNDMGYYCIYSDSRQNDIIANDNFEGQNYVTVSDGQYLVLSRCKFTDTPKKPVPSYTDSETVRKVQEALNVAGYDCGTPDGIIGSGTSGQIEKYQSDKGLEITGTITEETLSALGM